LRHDVNQCTKKPDTSNHTGACAHFRGEHVPGERTSLEIKGHLWSTPCGGRLVWWVDAPLVAAPTCAAWPVSVGGLSTVTWHVTWHSHM